MLFSARIIIIAVFLWGMAGGCKLEIPTEFPTPPPSPVATPLNKVEFKPDADLEKQIAQIAELARGKVGVAAVLLETGDAAFLNEGERFPMQSVYKLPIAMAVMDQIRLEKLDLEEQIGVTRDDMVRAGMRSPLRDANPNGGEFTIRELIRLSMVESDGTASDVLLRIGGGAPEVQSFLTQIGIRDMKVANTEKEIGRDWQTQYDNWATPSAAIELLRWIHLGTGAGMGLEPVQDFRNELEMLMQFMYDSNPGPRRLKGLLPKNVTAHKTGTSGTRNGITAATNDIGIIYLPSGKLMAIAVFISDSPTDEKTREAVIAKIAKAVWDRWNK